jgi:hypothetical protein
MNYCCYCGKAITGSLILTREHLVPVSKGGNNTQLNIRACCHICNNKRGNLDYDVFISLLEQEYSMSILEHMKGDLAIMIENTKALNDYVKSQGAVLYRGHAQRLSAMSDVTKKVSKPISTVKVGGRKYKIGRPIGFLNRGFTPSKGVKPLQSGHPVYRSPVYFDHCFIIVEVINGGHDTYFYSRESLQHLVDLKN